MIIFSPYCTLFKWYNNDMKYVDLYREPRSRLMIRKLSKIETLRLASSYISHLGNVLLLGDGLHDGQPCHTPSPPFFHVNSSPTRGSDQSGQPKHICTFCLSNQRKMVSRRTIINQEARNKKGQR